MTDYKPQTERGKHAQAAMLKVWEKRKMRSLMERNNTHELITFNGIISLTIVGYPNPKAMPPAALVMGYLTENPLAPTITCTAADARALGEFILAAADNAEQMVAELTAARRPPLGEHDARGDGENEVKK